MNTPQPIKCAFTWVPNPKILGIRPDFQFNSTIEYFKDFHRIMSFYEINPELTKEGNIHYHCVFVLKESSHARVTYYKKVLPKFKFNGFIKIKCKNIDEGWNKYMRKDNKIMSTILKVPLPISDIRYISTCTTTEEAQECLATNVKTIFDYIEQ